MSYVKHPSKFYKGTQQNKACARGAGGCMRVAVRSEGCGRGRPAGKPGIVPALGTPDAVSCHEKMPPPFAENLQAIHSIMNTQKSASVLVQKTLAGSQRAAKRFACAGTKAVIPQRRFLPQRLLRAPRFPALVNAPRRRGCPFA